MNLEVRFVESMPADRILDAKDAHVDIGSDRGHFFGGLLEMGDESFFQVVDAKSCCGFGIMAFDDEIEMP